METHPLCECCDLRVTALRSATDGELVTVFYCTLDTTSDTGLNLNGKYSIYALEFAASLFSADSDLLAEHVTTYKEFYFF